MSDALWVVAQRMVALETLTKQLLPHKQAMSAPDEFQAFADAVEAARAKYESFLEGCARVAEVREIALQNERTHCGLIADPPESEARH